MRYTGSMDTIPSSDTSTCHQQVVALAVGLLHASQAEFHTSAEKKLLESRIVVEHMEDTDGRKELVSAADTPGPRDTRTYTGAIYGSMPSDTVSRAEPSVVDIQVCAEQANDNMLEDSEAANNFESPAELQPSLYMDRYDDAHIIHIQTAWFVPDGLCLHSMVTTLTNLRKLQVDRSIQSFAFSMELCQLMLRSSLTAVEMRQSHDSRE